MNKRLISVLCVLFCSLPLAALASGPAAPAPQDTQKAQIAARFAAVNTIESSFTQQKYMALLDEPVTSEGVFYFQKPGRIRWQYKKPFQNGFLIVDGVTYRLEKDKKEKQSSPLSSNMAAQMLAWLTFDLETLSKQYTLNFTPDGVILTPQKEGFLKQIEVVFSKQNPQALSRVEIQETGGDKTVLIFHNPKTNQKLPAEAFK